MASRLWQVTDAIRRRAVSRSPAINMTPAIPLALNGKRNASGSSPNTFRSSTASRSMMKSRTGKNVMVTIPPSFSRLRTCSKLSSVYT
jgi:hypothetical protein